MEREAQLATPKDIIEMNTEISAKQGKVDQMSDWSINMGIRSGMRCHLSMVIKLFKKFIQRFMEILL
jgi:hypothetical protein